MMCTTVVQYCTTAQAVAFITPPNVVQGLGVLTGRKETRF
jgi:hypothetical protein